MKHYQLFVAIICSFCLTFSSCSKEQSQKMGETTKVSPSNPANPFDMVGGMHNEALRMTMNHCATKANASMSASVQLGTAASAGATTWMDKL